MWANLLLGTLLFVVRGFSEAEAEGTVPKVFVICQNVRGTIKDEFSIVPTLL